MPQCGPPRVNYRRRQSAYKSKKPRPAPLAGACESGLQDADLEPPTLVEMESRPLRGKGPVASGNPGEGRAAPRGAVCAAAANPGPPRRRARGPFATGSQRGVACQWPVSDWSNLNFNLKSRAGGSANEPKGPGLGDWGRKPGSCVRFAAVPGRP